MAIGLSAAERKKVDALVKAVFVWVVSGEVASHAAQNVIAHVLVAATKQDEDEVRKWLKPETLAEWKRTAFSGLA